MNCGNCNEGLEKNGDVVSCKSCKYQNITEEFSNDYKLKEWLNFNFDEYVQAIIAVLSTYKFEDLRAASQAEIKAGKFTDVQIENLREVLEDGFVNEKSIIEISKLIAKEVKLKDLLKMENGMIVKRNGKPVLKLSSEMRSILISRTETTRLASLGVLEHYKQKGASQYSWVASFGLRTCPICENLNGRIFEIGRGPTPPAHVACRCS